MKFLEQPLFLEIQKTERKSAKFLAQIFAADLLKRARRRKISPELSLSRKKPGFAN